MPPRPRNKRLNELFIEFTCLEIFADTRCDPRRNAAGYFWDAEPYLRKIRESNGFYSGMGSILFNLNPRIAIRGLWLAHYLF